VFFSGSREPDAARGGIARREAEARMVESCSLTDEMQKVKEIKTANKGADMKKIS
jgi:hypothetical protein